MSVVVFIFFAALLIQWLIWLLVFGRLAFLHIDDKLPGVVPHIPVSVVICARNEAKNLFRNLPGVLEQEYSAFEVIVVNDGSQDNTEQILEDFKQRYPHLLTVHHYPPQKILSGKRDALRKGIDKAKYDWIVLTDADCVPQSNKWLLRMVVPLAQGKEIVLGYSPYFFRRGCLNKLIRYETFFTAVQYFSWTLAGMPYMGVGRNMACLKRLLISSKSIHDINAPPSGDDDLMVNEWATTNNTGFVLTEDAFMWSYPAISWHEWMSQKIRHYTAARYYRLVHQMVLGGFYLSWLLFYLSAILIMWCDTKQKMLATSLFLAIIVTKWLFSRWLMQRFKCHDLWIIQPLLDFFLPLFLFTLGFVSWIWPIEWKNRIIHPPANVPR